ncbi:hypothetical protein [Paenibacillus kobensis]|uniref:hypothetical protein n=1 Tax=Paenibacillus kobensis TaxID=59841 RepID=UPI000FDB4A1E|nr:hypothetical protein [Paenibacillus kobensis]
MPLYLRKVISYSIVILFIVLIYVLYNEFFAPKPVDEKKDHKVIHLSNDSDYSKKIKTPSDIKLPSNTSSVSYGLQIYDSKGDFINRDYINIEKDNPLHLFASIINVSSQDDHVGLLVALDGEFQKFKVDGQKNQYIYHTELKKLSNKNIPITLDANGLSRYKRLDIVMIFYFNELPGIKKEYIDFYTNSIFFHINPDRTADQQLRASELQSGSSNIISLPDRFSGKIRGQGVRALIDAEDIQQTNLSQQNNVNFTDGHPLFFYSAGGKGKYASTIFLNNEPIAIDGKMTAYYELKDKELYAQKFNLSSQLSKGSYPLYCITVPLDDSPFVFSSQKSVLVIQ